MKDNQVKAAEGKVFFDTNILVKTQLIPGTESFQLSACRNFST